MKKLLSIVVSLFLLVLTPAHADDGSENNYQHKGVVSAHIKSDHAVIINDTRYHIDNEVSIHGKELFMVGFELKAGQQVGFNLDNRKSTSPRISEIWILAD